MKTLRETQVARVPALIDCGHVMEEVQAMESALHGTPEAVFAGGVRVDFVTTDSGRSTFAAGLAALDWHPESRVAVVLGDLEVPASARAAWHLSTGPDLLPRTYQQLLWSSGVDPNRVLLVSEAALRSTCQKVLSKDRRRKQGPDKTWAKWGWRIEDGPRRQVVLPVGDPPEPRSIEQADELLVVRHPMVQGAELQVGLRSLDFERPGQGATGKRPLPALIVARMIKLAAEQGLRAHLAIYDEGEDALVHDQLRGGAVVSAVFGKTVPADFVHAHVQPTAGGWRIIRVWTQGEIVQVD